MSPKQKTICLVTCLSLFIWCGVIYSSSSTDSMHGPACPSSQTQIPAQRNRYPSGLHHTAALPWNDMRGQITVCYFLLNSVYELSLNTAESHSKITSVVFRYSHQKHILFYYETTDSKPEQSWSFHLEEFQRRELLRPRPDCLSTSISHWDDFQARTHTSNI